jgi:hypothetical protein
MWFVEGSSRIRSCSKPDFTGTSGLLRDYIPFYRTSGLAVIRPPLLNLPARKPVVGENRQYLREGRMRGIVCASFSDSLQPLAEGAPVILAASLPGHVESW